MPVDKRRPEVITEIPDTPICGIYALVDSAGKRYIGSSKNIRQRMLAHKTHMNVLLRDGADGFLNPGLREAVQAGEKFHCEILASFNCAMEQPELREIERLFINKFGGYENTYNHSVIRHKI